MMTLPAVDSFKDQQVHHSTDNQSLLANIQRGYSERLAYLQRALRLRSSFIHDCNERGLAKSEYVDTKHCRADPLTKPLPFPACRETALRMGLIFGEGKINQEELLKIDISTE
jgi:hypothetical protein